MALDSDLKPIPQPYRKLCFVVLVSGVYAEETALFVYFIPEFSYIFRAIQYFMK